jgi:pyridoxamine 5'-phosphate oxidase
MGIIGRNVDTPDMNGPDQIKHPSELISGDFTAAGEPFELFAAWLAEATHLEPNDPNAMALATVDPDGLPDVRMVLLKGFDAAGFVFYSHIDSAKGRELAANPKAALLFHWKSLRRQVRIEGSVERAAGNEADAYFASRGRDSQLGAWASDQSRPLDSRETFERRFADLQRRFDGQDVPRPPHWGGYRVVPNRMEFWSDRPHRLHERRLFTRDGDRWTESLLYP